MKIIFDKSTFKPGEVITGSGVGKLIISKLGTKLSESNVNGIFTLPAMNSGSYAIELIAEDQSYWSALEVIENPWQRIRYGFLSEFADDIDTAKQVEWAKRLHLTSIQFYDWAYKHEYLVAPGESYTDPLGGAISKNKLKELIVGYEAAGIFPSGYAAVYAVDREGWERWKDSGLYSDDGKPFQLGEDFLWVIDPADEKWLPHFIEQLKAARDFGFKTFHLDQYGWPKRTVKADHTIVDLAEQFTKMLNAITAEVSGTQFIFNNVNDFPTWATAKTAQHASYIEVWSPNSEYKDLVHLVDKARGYDPNKPVILSAYLKPFAADDVAGANTALELSLSVISSRGASHLITGGDGKVLHNPYYVQNHQAGPSTLAILENYHNFITAAGDYLFSPTRVDITRTHSFGVNTEIAIESKEPISANFDAKCLTAAIFDSEEGITIHIHNLLDQENAEWDRAKNAITKKSAVKISILSAGYKNEWHIGRADQSSKFELQSAKQIADKLVLDVAITGAWTLIHIPKK